MTPAAKDIFVWSFLLMAALAALFLTLSHVGVLPNDYSWCSSADRDFVDCLRNWVNPTAAVFTGLAIWWAARQVHEAGRQSNAATRVSMLSLREAYRKELAHLKKHMPTWLEFNRLRECFYQSTFSDASIEDRTALIEFIERLRPFFSSYRSEDIEFGGPIYELREALHRAGVDALSLARSLRLEHVQLAPGPSQGMRFLDGATRRALDGLVEFYNLLRLYKHLLKNEIGDINHLVGLMDDEALDAVRAQRQGVRAAQAAELRTESELVLKEMAAIRKANEDLAKTAR